MSAKLDDFLDIKAWAKWAEDGLSMDWTTLVFTDTPPSDEYSEVFVIIGNER